MDAFVQNCIFGFGKFKTGFRFRFSVLKFTYKLIMVGNTIRSKLTLYSCDKLDVLAVRV